MFELLFYVHTTMNRVDFKRNVDCGPVQVFRVVQYVYSCLIFSHRIFSSKPFIKYQTTYTAYNTINALILVIPAGTLL